MRVLLSKESKKEIFCYLKKIHGCNSGFALATKLKIPYGTLKNWIQEKDRYIPKKFIPNKIIKQIEILDEQQDNWGRIKGGKKTYQVILKRYGLEEMRRRQSEGGKKRILNGQIQKERFKINILNPFFLEFYGILLGDGWIGRYNYGGKVAHWIGISGHSELDRDFFLYCRKNIKKLFNRNAYLKEKKGNAIDLIFCHKSFFEAFHKELNFPIGKKINLKLSSKIYELEFSKIKHVIRGVFDTDGSFYVDKTPVGKPYPCISIEMKAPILIKQLYKILIENGFKVSYRERRKDKAMITLKGYKQLRKWMEEIGSSNPKHLKKIRKFAPVAQLDSAMPS